MSGITVAPPIPGLFVVEDAAWKIKVDGRIVRRITGERHPDQIRDREAEKLRVWTAGGKRWTVNEAGQVCDADSGEVWIDPNADREIGRAKEMRGTKWLAKYFCGFASAGKQVTQYGACYGRSTQCGYRGVGFESIGHGQRSGG